MSIKKTCPICKTSSFRKAGVLLQSGKRKFQRLQCLNCGRMITGDLLTE